MGDRLAQHPLKQLSAFFGRRSLQLLADARRRSRHSCRTVGDLVHVRVERIFARLQKGVPLHRCNTGLNHRLGQQPGERGDALSRVNGAQPLFCQRTCSRSDQPGCCPDLRPGAPVDAERRQPLLPPVVGKAVQKGVGSRMVGLPAAAEEPGYRGEEHKELQRQLCGQLVQVPGPLQLGSQHRHKALPALLQQRTVVEHPHAVDHTCQRAACIDLPQDSAQLRPVCHICLCHRHLDTQLCQRLQLCLRLGSGSAAPDQQQMAGSLLCQPTGRSQPQPAQPAGDQVGGVGADGDFLAVQGRCQHDLADVLSLLHGAEGRDGLRDRVGGARNRLKFAALKTCEQLLQLLPNLVGMILDLRTDIQNVIGDVGTEGAHSVF